jgi:hypothetical protein
MSLYDDATLLTDAENHVLQLLGAAWNEFAQLPLLHPQERDEMCGLIHRCQEKVMARPVLAELNKKRLV